MFYIWQTIWVKDKTSKFTHKLIFLLMKRQNTWFLSAKLQTFLIYKNLKRKRAAIKRNSNNTHLKMGLKLSKDKMDVIANSIKKLIAIHWNLYKSYMWTHPHWAGVTRNFRQLISKKMLFGITRILSKSPALNHSVGTQIFIYLASLLTHHLCSNKYLATAVRYQN